MRVFITSEPLFKQSGSYCEQYRGGGVQCRFKRLTLIAKCAKILQFASHMTRRLDSDDRVPPLQIGRS